MGSPSLAVPRVQLRAAVSSAVQPAAAVAEVAEALGSGNGLVAAFVPERYDLDVTATALAGWAGSSVIACTSAGGIGPAGYAPGGLVAVALNAPDLIVHTVPVSPLSDLETACAIAAPRLSSIAAALSGRPAFAVLLVDGLSRAEEDVVHGLLGLLGDEIPIVGGSAADNLRFERALVLNQGRFVTDSATITVVSTSAPFRPLRVQHHVAGDRILVVTSATSAQRLVHTLNGRPAAVEYAEAVGVDVGELGPDVFSRHPLVIRTSGAEWMRSPYRREPDDSLRFLCSVERGSVLRMGWSTPPTAALEQAFADAREELGEIAGALVFDCILRRLEFEAGGIDGDVGLILAAHRAAGFSTFGEQFGGVHVNQTMVGIAFGE